MSYVTPLNTVQKIRSSVELIKYINADLSDDGRGSLTNRGQKSWTMYLPKLQNNVTIGKNNLIIQPVPQSKASETIVLTYNGATLELNMTFRLQTLQYNDNTTLRGVNDYGDVYNLITNAGGNTNNTLTYVTNGEYPVRTIFDINRFIIENILVSDISSYYRLNIYHRKWGGNDTQLRDNFSGPYTMTGFVNTATVKFGVESPDICELNITFIQSKNPVVQTLDVG